MDRISQKNITKSEEIRLANRDLRPLGYRFILDNKNFPVTLGRGGVGSVYKGYSKYSGYQVAIKCLKNKYISVSDIREKFLIEANIYMELDHPNIVKLRDFISNEQTEYRSYAILELVDGVDMSYWIKKVWNSLPIPTEVAIPLMCEILEGIRYAHNRKLTMDGYDGVLHLDIKPANILITSSGVKIIDYGISQGGSDVRAKRMMYSLPYAAPEQLLSDSVLDKRTDIYALGILFREMLTGQNWIPHTLRDTSAIKDWIQNKELPPISESTNNDNIDLQLIIDKAVEKDPNDRYQTCEDFLHDLKELEN